MRTRDGAEGASAWTASPASAWTASPSVKIALEPLKKTVEGICFISHDELHRHNQRYVR